jgi:hypothetical protein
MTRLNLLLLLCALFPVTIGCAAAAQSSPETFRVEVADANSHRSLKGAQVFLLSEDGRRLASAVTNDQGIATMRRVDASQKPLYVIVDHPTYFLGGLRWRDGISSYYVLMTILTIP